MNNSAPIVSYEEITSMIMLIMRIKSKIRGSLELWSQYLQDFNGILNHYIYLTCSTNDYFCEVYLV
jgi:hypothetical protein